MSNAKVVPSREQFFAPSNVRSLDSWLPLAPVPDENSAESKPSSVMPPVRLNRVMDFVDANISLDLCISTLATVAGMSAFYFCRSFKHTTGITPHRYVLHRRMEHAKRLLQQPSGSLLEVAQEVGFADQSQFTRVFHRIVGTTPSRYRKLAARPYFID